MVSTHASLLVRVRRPDAPAWELFERRYGPLVLAYAMRMGLSLADAEDVRQDVLVALTRAMPAFAYDPARGRFRDYLRSAVRHAVSRRAMRHAVGPVRLHEDGASTRADADDHWEDQWRRHHCRLAMETLRRSESARNVEVFTMLLAGADAGQVAEAMGISSEAARKIKQRVRDRLREIVLSQIRDEDAPRADRSNPA